MKKTMLTKIKLYGLSLLLVAATSGISFAEALPELSNNSVQSTDEITESTSEVITDVVGEEDVVDNYIETRDFYVFNSNGTKVTIPKEESESLIVSVDHERDVAMGLPEIIDQEGELSENGTVVYNSLKEDAQVSVQVIDDSNIFDGSYAVRTMIIIDSSDAPREYEFPFELPKGYSLVRDYDYEQMEEVPCGEAYVLDENGEIANVIEAAWAVDANQSAIPTHYEIQKNTLIQVVDFDENTAFPIVADPTSHPRKTRVVKLNKSQVLKTRNQYTGSSALRVVNGIFTVASLAAYKVPAIGTAWALIQFAGKNYYQKNFDTWDRIYTKMGKNKYAEITFSYRWVGGHSHSAYIPSGVVKCRYVNK